MSLTDRLGKMKCSEKGQVSRLLVIWYGTTRTLLLNKAFVKMWLYVPNALHGKISYV